MDSYERESLSRLSSSSKKSSYEHLHSREKFLSKVILPAISSRSCPICLRNLDQEHGVAVITNCLHAYCLNCIRRWSELKRKCPLCTAEFDSWFCNINPRFKTFREEKLPPPRTDEDGSAAVVRSNSNSDHRSNSRAFRRSRDQMNDSIGRRRQLPLRRTFGRAGSVPPDVIAERKLQWRASIYSRRLRAVPHRIGNSQKQDISRNSRWKEQVLQRIEPWIHRELEAILGDTDPSIIVHVVTSIFIKNLEEKLNDQSTQIGDRNLTTALEPFLHESLHVFWHELRCYAESSLTMETYDSVTEYRRME